MLDSRRLNLKNKRFATALASIRNTQKAIMISVENLKVEFGVKPLFQDVSFVVNDRDRIALVGKNGAGKSTLLKILCGPEILPLGTCRR